MGVEKVAKLAFKPVVVLSFGYHLNRQVFSILSSPSGQKTILKWLVNKIVPLPYLDLCFPWESWMECTGILGLLCKWNHAHSLSATSVWKQSWSIHSSRISYHPRNVLLAFCFVFNGGNNRRVSWILSQTPFRELVLSNRQTYPFWNSFCKPVLKIKLTRKNWQL